ncbi:MAG: phasin family protein [Alphaproteobacteria bacterium]
MTATKKTASSAKSKTQTEALPGMDDLAAFGQGNVDAFVKAGSVFAEGLQNINKMWLDLAQESADTAAQAVEKSLSCKSLTEVLEVQSKISKSNYDKLMANSQKLSEMSQKLAEDVAQPIAERARAASENFAA